MNRLDTSLFATALAVAHRTFVRSAPQSRRPGPHYPRCGFLEQAGMAREMRRL